MYSEVVLMWRKKTRNQIDGEQLTLVILAAMGFLMFPPLFPVVLVALILVYLGGYGRQRKSK